MTELQITIEPDGRIRFVHDAELAAAYALCGQQTKVRASHVEPVHGLLRALFRALRAHSTDHGPVAAFTRRWPCRWEARIVNGPVLGPYRDRSAAIAAEVAWLRENEL